MGDRKRKMKMEGESEMALTIDTRRKFNLEKENELRVEIGMDSSLKLKLVNGTAEIFGMELPPMFWMTFPAGHKFAVFTWYGCTIEMDGVSELAYVSDETPMVTYAKVHNVLEQQRKIAKKSTSLIPSPRCIIVGPTDHGKSSLARMLLGWATREGWKPTYVDLDISQGSIAISGTVSATLIQAPIDPIEGIPLDEALVYFYGHATPSINVDLYKALVDELASTLNKKSTSFDEAAGMVINTMGWVEGVGFELLLHAIETLQVDVVLVLGHEELHSMLQKALEEMPGVAVVKLLKSSGVVTRNQKYRQEARAQKTKEYFYGISNDLSPYSRVAYFCDLQVFKIGGDPPQATNLPIGANSVVLDPTRVVPMSFSYDLLYHVLAISFATDPKQLLLSNIAGFIYITKIDMVKRRVTYMAPCPGPLPSQLLLARPLVWILE